LQAGSRKVFGGDAYLYAAKKTWVLNFKGRVKISSVKNFQIASDVDSE